MNSPERLPEESRQGAQLDAAPTDSERALYQGDHGELSLDARRALAQLLTGPAMDARRHSKLWPVLTREEAAIRGRLSDLFLRLVIDHDSQVAFIRQADTGDLDAPSLLRRANLTFIDSVLLLHLRERLTQASAHGDRAVISGGDVMEFLRIYERDGDSDQALFNKRVNSAIEKIKKHGVLRKLRSSDDRYEISPTLKLLFSAEEAQALTRAYHAIAAGRASAGDMPADLPTDEADDDEAGDLTYEGTE